LDFRSTEGLCYCCE